MRTFEQCRAYRKRFIMTEQQHALCSLLEDYSYIVPELDQNLRDYSISFFGIPVLYSIKYAHGRSQKTYRTIFEPGSRNLTVSQQIDQCLLLVGEAADQLGWTGHAADSVNNAVRVLFPSDAALIENWEGGMWLGMDASDDPPMIKMYASLRNYKSTEAWQKLVDVFGEFSGWEMEPVLRKIMEHAAKVGNLVGLCYGFDRSGLRGIRFYSDMTHPTLEQINLLGRTFFPDKYGDSYAFCNNFVKRFGEFGKEAVTMGFDFAADSQGVLIPKLLRIKFELSCCLFSEEDQRDLPDWIEAQGSEFGFPCTGIVKQIEEAKECLGDIFFHYVSVGLQEKQHLTLYYESFSQDRRLIYKIRRTILRIQSFLCNYMEESGVWKDFNLFPGSSDSWVTAYTGLCLLSSGNSKRIQAAIQCAVDFLKLHYKKSYGWGYNQNVICDCDSTAYATQFLRESGNDENYGELLMRFQCEDGGFSTYDEEKKDGWNISQPDITAIAMNTIALYDSECAVISRAMTYLDQWEGFVPSYWWATPYYATLKKKDAYTAAKIPFDDRTIMLQLDTETLPTTPYDLALYLELYCKTGGKSDRIREAAKSLLEMEEGGRFQTYPILRVSHRCNVQADNADGPIVCDENGIFTAATALRTLAICCEKLEKEEYSK